MSTSSSPVPTVRLLLIAVTMSAANAAIFFRPELIPSDLTPMINLIFAMLLAIEVLWLSRTPASSASGKKEGAEKAPTPKVSREERTRHELANFLGLLQEKGRLVDFLMEDIKSQPDDRVGQVARVVHQGCKTVLDQHFEVEPLRTESEGQTLTLEADFAPASIRMVGTVPSDGDIKGKLVHKGWASKSVSLPEITRALPETSGSYIISPAELDVS